MPPQTEPTLDARRPWVRRLSGAVAALRALGGALSRQRVARRRLGIVAAGFLVCAYAAGVLGYVMLRPEVGIRCAFTPEVTHFYHEFLYPEGQPLSAGLKEGDRIVALGGQPVENWSQYLRKLNGLREGPAEEVPGLKAADLLGEPPALAGKDLLLLDGHRLVRVRYERPDGPGAGRHSAWCRLGHSPVETLVPSVLWFFLKIGLFLVGALVFWKRPEDRSAAQFFLFCIVSFGAYMGGYHWSRIVTQPALLLVFVACALFLPAVSLHFYLLFPRPKPLLERHPHAVPRALYAPPVCFLLFLLFGYLHVRLLGQDGRGAAAEAVRAQLEVMLHAIYFYFGVAALMYLASIASLAYSYRTADGPLERNQVKWVLFGSLAAVVPIGYSLYLAFWQPARFGGGAATWWMFAASLCVTAAFAVSITRYRLMQLDQLVSSGFVYFLISCVAVLVYYGLVFAGMVLVGSQVGEGPSLLQVLAVSSTALVLTVTLNLIRGRLQRALDRHYRREKHQLDTTLRRLSEAIEQLTGPQALAHRLLHTSADLLGVVRGAVYLRRGDPPLYRLVDALGSAPELVELSSGCPLVEALRERLTLEAPAYGPADAGQRQLQFLGGAVAQALQHEGQLLGLLVLGPRGGPYSAEDLNLLAAFAQISALALVGAEGHRTIDALNRELQAKVEKIAEQQRRILALQNQLTSRSAVDRGLRAEDRGQRTEDRGQKAAPAAAPAEAPDGVVGSSVAVRELMGLVRRVAASSSAVLLRGESGTGKELLARALHDNSPRAARPFVKVHCAALSPGLLESELFGHVKGAFTSAIRDKVGRFESAHGGTLFLDEIGDVSLEVQTKLLRVLEEMTFERVGSSEPVKVDVRVIAATHQDLEALMRQGRFREDLFFRLNVFPITLPPLRERVEDVPELALHFLRLYGQKAGKAIGGLDDDALAALKAYRWPGNVRQLENVIERAVVVADGPVITLRELPPELLADRPEREGPAHAGGILREADLLPEVRAEETELWSPGLTSPLPAALAPSGGPTSVIQAERADRERRERELLVRALAAAGGNKAEAARALGMARSTLVSRLKRLGLG
jgi:transcriptional regulator with GAF, ATPase, and Fis domain